MNAKNQPTKEEGIALIKDAKTIVNTCAEVMQMAEADFLRVLGAGLKHAPTSDILIAMDFLMDTVRAHAEAQFTASQVEFNIQRFVGRVN